MKALILLTLFCLTSTVLTGRIELKSKVKNIIEECMTQEHITADEIDMVFSDNFANPTDNFKCFHNCVFEKLGMLKNNVIQEDSVKAIWAMSMGEDMAHKIYERCKDIKAKDRCDTAFQILTCGAKAVKDL